MKIKNNVVSDSKTIHMSHEAAETLSEERRMHTGKPCEVSAPRPTGPDQLIRI